MSNKHECNDVCVEHYNEMDLKCPYCLEEGSDSWEVLRDGGNESGTTDCGECGKEYKYGTEITYRDGGVHSIYYTTFQLDSEEAQS